MCERNCGIVGVLGLSIEELRKIYRELDKSGYYKDLLQA